MLCRKILAVFRFRMIIVVVARRREETHHSLREQPVISTLPSIDRLQAAVTVAVTAAVTVRNRQAARSREKSFSISKHLT
mmetsp:Transcript_11324/g.22070  ORF Transcript_11324/g.22070 Transcript_11324/m.22070 type:complete len:80 (+) Transcript_11324:1016-1255(+)